jgi:hypothetical protein
MLTEGILMHWQLWEAGGYICATHMNQSTYCSRPRTASGSEPQGRWPPSVGWVLGYGGLGPGS